MSVTWTIRIMIAMGGLLSSVCTAEAHHSFAMFDPDKDLSIEGTVQDFTWTNPHVWVDVMVVGPAGTPVKWGLETQSVGILHRMGWGPESLKKGDRIKVDLHPMKDGTPGGQLMKITFPDGRELLTAMARRPAQATPAPAP
jgi:hypothetical protein